MQTSETNGVITTVNPAPAALISLGSDDACRTLYASFDTSTEEGSDNLARCLTDERKLIWYEAPCTVNAVHVVTYESVEVNEETGEVGPHIRFLIIDDQGVIWSTGSRVAFNYLLRIVSAKGTFPWLKPRQLVFKKTITQNKKECLICTLPISSTSQTTNSPSKKDKSAK